MESSKEKSPNARTPLVLLDTSEMDLSGDAPHPPHEPTETDSLTGQAPVVEPFKSYCFNEPGENETEVIDTSRHGPHSNGGDPATYSSRAIGQLLSSTDLQGSQAIDPWDHNKLELDMGQLGPPLPPDGGWGWVIVMGSFLCMVLVDGMCFSYGIFLSELEATFNASKRKMTLAGSLVTGCYLLMGPITSALANQFGFRVMIFSGAIISAVSFFLSAFIYNLDVFIIVFGVCGGIGFGLIYLPAVTVISLWFHDRRATATGIAVCGSGIGSAIYGFLLPYLIDKYTWRGCIIILAAISFNCAVAGAVFRPLSDYQEEQMKKKGRSQSMGASVSMQIPQTGPGESMQELVRKYTLDMQTATGLQTASRNGTMVGDRLPASLSQSAKLDEESDPMTDPDITTKKKKKKKKKAMEPFKKSKIIQRTIDSKKKEMAVSVGSLDNMLITADNRLVHVPSDYIERPMLSMNKINKIVESVVYRQDSRRTDRSRSSIHSSVRMSADYVQPGDGAILYSQPSSRRNSYYSSVVSMKPAVDRGAVLDEDMKSEIVSKIRREIARPMQKKDVFYSGSMIHLNDYVGGPQVESYVRSITSIPDSGAGANAIGNAMRKMLDLSILKSPTFILLIISSCFSMVGFIVPFQFLNDNSQHLGYGKNVSSYLMSILGGANTIGRILSGLISDQKWADCLWINNVALIVAGGATMLLPLCTTYALLSLYCCVYGLFIAAFVSLRTIVVVNLMGLDRLTNAFGFLLLFQGMAIILGPPLLGSFFDTLQNYDYTFVLGGASLVLSGILCFPLRLVSRWENRTKSRPADAGNCYQSESAI